MEQLEDEDYNSGWSVMSVQNMKWNSKGAYFGASLSWCGFDASTLMFQSPSKATTSLSASAIAWKGARSSCATLSGVYESSVEACRREMLF